jgi:hypothetical protein
VTGDTAGGRFEVANPVGANGMFWVSNSARHRSSATLETALPSHDG